MQYLLLLAHTTRKAVISLKRIQCTNDKSTLHKSLPKRHSEDDVGEGGEAPGYGDDDEGGVGLDFRRAPL